VTQAHPAARAWRAGSAALWRDERLRFLMAGAWNTAFGYAAFVLVHQTASPWLNAWIQIAFAYALALPQSFAVQKYVVFRRRGHRRQQWRRFAIANTMIFVANLILVPWLVDVTGWPALAVQAGYVVASAVVSYFVHRNFSFAENAS
jgi:putative flippase GtrA